MDSPVTSVVLDTPELASSEADDIADGPETAQILSEVLAEILKVEQVNPDDDFFQDLGADSMVMARFCARIRKRCDKPSLSMKDVYANPTIQSLASAIETAPSDAGAPTAETGALQETLAGVLAEVLKVEHVNPDDNYFQDLGADSMVMARFCARLRKQDDLPSVSMKQVYEFPTIRNLAATVAKTAPTVPALAPSLADAPPSTPAPDTEPIAYWRYVLCGVLQFLTAYVFLVIGSEIFVRAYAWTLGPSDWLDIYLRTLIVTLGFLVAAIVIPILGKWAIIGRWKPQEIRIWSLAYYRFWFVSGLIQANPLVLFKGTWIYALYLRALGAKIGRNTLILSPNVPICTDLLTIGDNAVIRSAAFSCYRAQAGRIQIGPVTLGKDTVVGETAVLDINTSMGDGAQLGHSSSLYEGQSIPAGEHRQGSPAQQKTDFDYADVEAKPCGKLRRVAYPLVLFLPPLFLLTPVIMAILVRIVVWFAGRPYFDLAGVETLTHFLFYRDAIIVSTVLFVGVTILGFLFVVTIPRLLNLAIKPDKVYPLFGIRYWVQGMIAGFTNVQFFTHLFGDSSYIVYYLRAIGYDLSKVVQTGSNFGLDLAHDNPFLVKVGSGTMVADGLASINVDYSSSSFRVSRVEIGANNFLGNNVLYPAQGKTGDNCLLANMVMVPVDGEVREGTGLLGSPCFEVPRRVVRDSELSKRVQGEELRRRLRMKNRYNLVSMGLFLLIHWIYFTLFLLMVFATIELFFSIGSLAIALAVIVAVFVRLFYYAFVDRASTLFRRLTPQTCSIYDPYFWFHERHWKLTQTSHSTPFNGTPLKGFVWWLLGVRIGRRVFDDGCEILERTMVTLGDDCTLNSGSMIEPHSQEEIGFKSDYVAIGAGCTLGIGSWVHYGTTMGDGSSLGPNAFLMKGEEVPPHAIWGENPAREIGHTGTAEAVPRPLPMAIAPAQENGALTG